MFPNYQGQYSVPPQNQNPQTPQNLTYGVYPHVAYQQPPGIYPPNYQQPPGIYPPEYQQPPGIYPPNYPPPAYGGLPPQTGFGAPTSGLTNPATAVAALKSPDQRQIDGWIGELYLQLTNPEITELQNRFQSGDRDRSGKISASELIAVETGVRGMSLNTAQMLVRIFDKQHNGEIEFFDFCVLHKFINGMQRAFTMYDSNANGRLERQEVYLAVTAAGFAFSHATIDKLLTRFSRVVDRNRQSLDFESFVQLCAYLGQVRHIYDTQDRDRDGVIKIDLDGLIQLSSSMPRV